MTPSSDDQPEFSQMLLRMTEIWRNNMEQAGEVEKLWSNSMRAGSGNLNSGDKWNFCLTLA
ncbi:hypothetical protein ACVJMZ_000055 [Sinorhizobium medicae]